MTNLRMVIVVLCGLLGLTMNVNAQPADIRQYAKGSDMPVRIACIGNSITYGDVMAQPSLYSYPAQLGKMLGEGYDVRNYGLCGRTMLKNGDKPYWIEPAYQECKDFNPDIVIIKLGTNDTKAVNWPYHKAEYGPDMQDMIDELQALPSSPVIYLGFPAKSFSSYCPDEILTDEIIPVIKEIAEKNNLKTIDFHTAFEDKQYFFFADNVHPTENGATLMATLVKETIINDLIKNGSFESGVQEDIPTPEGWSVRTSDDVITSYDTNSTDGEYSFKISGEGIRNYEMYQSITNLPPGEYTISADFLLNLDTKSNIYVQVNNDDKIESQVSADNDEWNNIQLSFKTESNDDVITFGAIVSGDECYIDNFSLVAEQMELFDVYKKLISEKRATLEGLYGTLNTRLNEQIDNALDSTSQVEDNIEDMESALLLLYNVEKEALLMQPVYVQMTDNLHLYSELLDVTEAPYADRNAYNEIIENVKAGLPQIETAQEILAMQQQINDACILYMNTARLIEGKTADMSFMIKDHCVTVTSGNWINKAISQETAYDNAPDNVYLHYWNGLRTMYQNIVLPQGIYKLTAATRASVDVKENYIYMNVDDMSYKADGHKVGNSGNLLGMGWGYTQIEDIRVYNYSNNITVGFYIDATNWQWGSADNFKLEKVGELPSEEENIKNGDYTSYLKNPNFEYKNETELSKGEVIRVTPFGWYDTGGIIGNSFGTSADASNKSGYSCCWYNSTPMPDNFELYQVVEGLPSGEYTVHCKLALFSDRETNERLFANNVVQYYGSSDNYDKNIVQGETYSFAGHTFGPTFGANAPLQEMVVKVLVLDGEPLKVGIRSSNLKADGTRATDNSGWFKVDDFRIRLVRRIDSDNLSSIADSLIDEAQRLYDNTVGGLKNGQYPQESRMAFSQIIDEVRSICDNNTSNDEIIMAIEKLNQAVDIYKSSIIDYNSYIQNRSFEYKAEGVLNDGSVVRGIPYGWNTVGTLLPDAWGNQSYGINNGAVNQVGVNSCWINSSVMPQPFELYQEVDGLPAGRYSLTCRMACFTNYISTQRLFANNNVTYFGSEEDYDKNITPGEINSFAGHQPSADVYLKEMKVEFVLQEGETLRLGIRSGNILKDGSTATDNSGWFRVDEFALDYLGIDGMEFDENISSPFIESESNCDVLLRRSFNENDEWNTFCVPFDIDYEQAAKYFKDIRKLQSVDCQDMSCILGFSDEIQNTVEAGVPYIVKTNGTYESMFFNDVNVKNVSEEERAIVVSDGIVEAKMIGNYGMIDNLEDKYFIKDNRFCLAGSENGTEVKGYRAIVEVNDFQSDKFNELFIEVDGVVTAIDKVMKNNNHNGRVYDITGKVVDNEYGSSNVVKELPKGIYVVNGKKIINK